MARGGSERRALCATEPSARSERDERPERLSEAAGARERSGLSEGARRSERPKRAFHKLFIEALAVKIRCAASCHLN